MKKIFKYLFFITIAFTVTSCMTDIDDFDSPKETLKGTVYDKFTGKPMMTETGHMRIKLEELSWSDTPTPQYFGNKQDGTYFNSMIFQRTLQSHFRKWTFCSHRSGRNRYQRYSNSRFHS
jgi:hypothetical protein